MKKHLLPFICAFCLASLPLARAQETTEVTAYEGATEVSAPFAFDQSSYVSQTLYPASVLGVEEGEILSIAYEGTFSAGLSSDITLWMGETQMTDLTEDWVDPATLQQVYQGKGIALPEGENQELAFTLDTPYDYQGGTLVVYMLARHQESTDAACTFQGSIIPTDEETWEPESPYVTRVYGTSNAGAPFGIADSMELSKYWSMGGMADLPKTTFTLSGASSEDPQEPEEPAFVLSITGEELDSCTYQPFGFDEQCYASQMLYKAEEMNYVKGEMSALVYYGSFKEDLTTNAKVWVGETDFTNVYLEWVDPAEMTLVYEGPLDIAQGSHSLEIPFSTPYDYQGRNFVVYTFCENESINDDPEVAKFLSHPVYNAQSSYMSGPGLDPENLSSGDESTFRPNMDIRFSALATERCKLTFAVQDEAGATIPDACITLNDSTYPAGHYVFDSLMAMGYEYTVAKEGYSEVMGTVVLSEGEQTETVTLTSLSNIPAISDYFYEDFDNIDAWLRPNGFGGDFKVEEGGGMDGGNRLAHSFWFFDGERTMVTNPVFMGSNPVFKFWYRVMDFQTYPEGMYNGENLEWKIEVSTNMGGSWTEIHKEDFGEHEASMDYKLFELDVTSYANAICQFRLTVNRDFAIPDEFFFDIDNMEIGTQHTHDLAVVSPVKADRIVAKGSEGEYTVVVKNSGTEESGSYTVRLMEGDTEVASATGSGLASKASATHTLTWEAKEEGLSVLRAEVEYENDEVNINDKSLDIRVSVAPEGTIATNIADCEGSDFGSAPYDFYNPYSLTQTMYFKEELAYIDTNTEFITGIAYKIRFDEPLEKKRITIWLGESDSADMFYNIVPVSQMTKVFEGAVDFSDVDGDNLMINFTTPYKYHGRNLVVCSYKEDNQAYPYEQSFEFYGKNDMDPCRNFTFVSEEPLDLEALNPNPNSTSERPEEGGYATFINASTVILTREDIAAYTVTFNVVDEQGQPVADATLTFDGKVLAPGEYVLADVPDGTYPYSVEATDGRTAEGEVEVAGSDVTETVVLEGADSENRKIAKMIQILPNPNNGQFRVCNVADAKELCIYDIYGKLVFKRRNIKSDAVEVDLGTQRSGLYLLVVDGKTFKVTKR